jgi:hypothetical protein
MQEKIKIIILTVLKKYLNYITTKKIKWLWEAQSKFKKIHWRNEK